MRSFQKTIVAIISCAMLAVLFNACNKDENTDGNILDITPPDLIGTWTEKNNLFTDVLTLRKNGEFTFQSHLDYCNGSGNYKFQRTVSGTPDFSSAGSTQQTNIDIIILYFAGRGSETLKIINLTKNKLELSDRYDNVYHFNK